MLHTVLTLRWALCTSFRFGHCCCAAQRRAASTFSVHTPPARLTPANRQGQQISERNLPPPKQSTPNPRQRKRIWQKANAEGSQVGRTDRRTSRSLPDVSRSPQHEAFRAALVASDLEAAAIALSNLDLAELLTKEHQQLLQLADAVCSAELAESERFAPPILQCDMRLRPTIQACALCIQLISAQSEKETKHTSFLQGIFAQWLLLEIRYGNAKYVVQYVEAWVREHATGKGPSTSAAGGVATSLSEDPDDLIATPSRDPLTRPHAAALLTMLVIARASLAQQAIANSTTLQESSAAAADSHLLHIVDLVRSLRIGFPGYTFFGSRSNALIDEALPAAVLRLPAASQLRKRAKQWLLYVELARGLDIVEEPRALTDSNLRGSREQLTRLMGSLVAQGNLDDVEALYHAAIDAADAGWLRMSGGDAIARSNSTSRHLRWHWTPGTWAVVLEGLISANRTAAAREVWSMMCSRGEQNRSETCSASLPTSARVWRALIDGHAARGNWRAVESTWAQLQSIEVTSTSNQSARRWQGPDANVYTSFLSATFRARQPDFALAVFSKMRQVEAAGRLSPPEAEIELSELTAKGGGAKIPVETYNAVLHGLYTTRRSVEAKLLLASMQKDGPTPNISTFNTVIRAQSRADDLPGLAESLRGLADANLEPDVITFTNVLDALLRRGSSVSPSEAVTKVLGLMEQTGVQPNAVTYTAIITALFANTRSDTGDEDEPGKADKLHAALEILAKMEEAAMDSRPGVVHRLCPTEVTYTALMAILTKKLSLSGAGDADIRTRPAIPVPYGAPPRPRADLSETTAEMHALTQQQPGIAASLVLLDRMRRLHLEPNRKTCNYLLSSLLGTFDTASAGDDRGGGVEASHAAIANTVMLRRGMSLVHSMLDQSSSVPEPNIRTWHTIFSALTMRASAQLQQRGDSVVRSELDSVEALASVVKVFPRSLLDTVSGKALKDAMNKAKQLLTSAYQRKDKSVGRRAQ